MFALIGRLFTRYPETIMSTEYDHGVLYLPRSAPQEPALLTEQFEAFNICESPIRIQSLLNSGSHSMLRSLCSCAMGRPH
jgi:hypothetical protein